MIQLGDLPHKRFTGRNWEWFPFGGKPAWYWDCVGHATAHSFDNIHKQPCQRCGKISSVVVANPESPYVWCFECY